MTTWIKGIAMDYEDGISSLRIDKWLDNDGTPFCVYHRRALRIGLADADAVPDDAALLEWARDELGEHLTALCDGYNEHCDGNNYVGTWTDDVYEQHHEAIDEIICEAQRLGTMPTQEVWEASDYYMGGLPFDALVELLGVGPQSTEEEVLAALEADADGALDGNGRPCTITGCERFASWIFEQIHEDDED